MAVVHSARDGIRVSAELGTAGEPNASRPSWLAVVRFGAIAMIAHRPGVGAGCRACVTRAAPGQRVLARAIVRG